MRLRTPSWCYHYDHIFTLHFHVSVVTQVHISTEQTTVGYDGEGTTISASATTQETMQTTFISDVKTTVQQLETSPLSTSIQITTEEQLITLTTDTDGPASTTDVTSIQSTSEEQLVTLTTEADGPASTTDVIIDTYETITETQTDAGKITVRTFEYALSTMTTDVRATEREDKQQQPGTNSPVKVYSCSRFVLKTRSQTLHPYMYALAVCS